MSASASCPGGRYRTWKYVQSRGVQRALDIIVAFVYHRYLLIAMYVVAFVFFVVLGR